MNQIKKYSPYIEWALKIITAYYFVMLALVAFIAESGGLGNISYSTSLTIQHIFGFIALAIALIVLIHPTKTICILAVIWMLLPHVSSLISAAEISHNALIANITFLAPRIAAPVVLFFLLKSQKTQKRIPQ